MKLSIDDDSGVNCARLTTNHKWGNIIGQRPAANRFPVVKRLKHFISRSEAVQIRWLVRETRSPSSRNLLLCQCDSDALTPGPTSADLVALYVASAFGSPNFLERSRTIKCLWIKILNGGFGEIHLILAGPDGFVPKRTRSFDS